MVTCPRCGRGNEGKYRFCLGCGAALPANDLRQTAGVAARGAAPLTPTSPPETAKDAAESDKPNAKATGPAAAASLNLPPRRPPSAVQPTPVVAIEGPEEGVTAAVMPILVGAAQLKKQPGGPAISPRAARSEKSQPIQVVVVSAVASGAAAIADQAQPQPTPALGIGGGTLRQGARPGDRAGDAQGDRPKSGSAIRVAGAGAPPLGSRPTPWPRPGSTSAAAMGTRPNSSADSPTSQSPAALPGFAVSPSAPSAQPPQRPQPLPLPPARAPTPGAAAKPAVAGGAPPPMMRYSQPVRPPGSPAGPTDVAPMPSPVPAPPPPNQVLCPACTVPVPPSNTFCGGCGAVNPYYSPTLPMPAGTAMARPNRFGYVALIDDNGGESVQFPLMSGENRIGSGETCQLRFPDDGFLARVHCTVEADASRVVLRPLDHSNGVFLRITTPVELQHGEIVRMGQEILRFERFDRLTPEVSSDSLQESVGWQPPRGVWGRLCQLGLNRQVANAYLLASPDVFLGRERGDILFPRDGFVSGSHAVLSDRNGRSFLKDLGSSNGTFIMVKQDTPLRNGDLFLLGRNLLRVHLGASS